jgi:adhesin/invasin
MRRSAAPGVALALSACTFGSGTETGPEYASAIVANAATNGLTGVVGRPLPQAVGAIVIDPSGGPVSGVVVTWTVVDSTGTTSATTSTTDATGNATVTWTLDTIARVDSLTASIPSGASTTLTAFGVAGRPAAITKVSGNPQAVASGSKSLPLVIAVADAYGNVAAGVAVTWAVTGGGALSASATTTGENGQSFVTLTTTTTPGNYVVTATVGSLAAATFAITSY